MKKAELIASLVTLSCIIFVIEAVSMQMIYNSMDIFRTPLSPYATGDLWYIVSSGLMMIATSYMVLAYQFTKCTDTDQLRVRIGSIVLIAVGICTYSLTIFYTDIGHTVSLRGHIHIISAHLHFILLPVSIIFISSGLRGKFWKKYRIYSLLFSTLLIIAGVALTMKKTLGIYSYSGIIQKLLILTIVIWIAVSAQMHLRFQKRFTNILSRGNI
jgi:uncharacterized membrane protein SirB2